MMKTNDMQRERVLRLREAGEWLLRLQNTKPGEQTVDRWLRWCDEHSENFNTFQRLQQSWRDLDSLKPHARALRVLAAPEPQARIPGSLFPPPPRDRRRFVWALAAGLAAVAPAVFYLMKPATPPTQQVSAALINRSATLPDGSKMILGAQSHVNVNFENSRRQLDLSRGEAYFRVKHDAVRPFIVRAGEVSVKAIGTAFDVRRAQDGAVTVTVEEGVVEVSSSSPAPAGEGPGVQKSSPVWRAEAGYQLTYSMRERSARLDSIVPSEALAWRSGELAYVREPLTSVVEDLNRNSTQRIVLEDRQVSQIRFTGTAFASAVEDWAIGITQIYPVEMRKGANGEISLRSRIRD